MTCLQATCLKPLFYPNLISQMIESLGPLSHNACEEYDYDVVVHVV